MVVTCVHVSVKAEHIDDFIKATRINHEASIRESQNMRFDVLQDPNDPSKFILYEAYASADGAAAHRETPHYLTWLNLGRAFPTPWLRPRGSGGGR